MDFLLWFHLLPPNTVTRSAWQMWNGLPHPTFLQRTGSMVGSTNFFWHDSERTLSMCSSMATPFMKARSMVGCVCCHGLHAAFLASQISEACQRSKLDQRPSFCFFQGGWTPTQLEGVKVINESTSWECMMFGLAVRKWLGADWLLELFCFKGYWSVDFSLNR